MAFGRVVLGLALVAALTGCTQAWMQEPVVPPAPSVTPTPSQSATTEPTPEPTPTADPIRDRYPYDGSVVDDTCVAATRGELDDLEELAGWGEAVSFSHAALVRSNHPWWTVAVGTRVARGNPDVSRNDVPMVLWFVTNAPTLTAGDPVSTWPFDPDPDDDAADRALTCLSRIPEPPPEPPEDSRASYTGRLARDATCTVVSPEMLKHLQAVGRVGGAITYSRGQMVQANKKWWTVAVVTEVHPNSLGYTRENVPPVAYFITNAPSKESGGTYFVLNPEISDTAAPAARQCLSG